MTTTEEERRRRAAARQARYRKRTKLHERGDHSKCLPGAACKDPVDLDEAGLNDGRGDAPRDVTPSPKNPVSHRPPPAGLGPRGLRLWDEMAGFKFGPHHVLVLERACRKADRLERMDAQLRGREWVHLVEVPDSGGLVVQVVVDKLLSEVRQTEIALKLDVAELRHAGRPAAAGPAAPPAPNPPTSEEGGEGAGQRRGLAAIKGGLGSTG